MIAPSLAWCGREHPKAKQPRSGGLYPNAHSASRPCEGPRFFVQHQFETGVRFP
jgi:hypothetical protein